MVCYWQWIKRCLLTQKSNQIFNKFIKIKSLWLFYVLVTRNIAVVDGDTNTKVAFKNCAPLRKCIAEVSETFIDDAEHINIAMPMYNLIEYGENYSDTSGSLWQFKRDESTGNINLTNNNSSSFKYKANLISNTDADRASRKKRRYKSSCTIKIFE